MKAKRNATRVPNLIGIQAAVARQLGKSVSLVSQVANGHKRSRLVEEALKQETYRRIRRSLRRAA